MDLYDSHGRAEKGQGGGGQHQWATVAMPLASPTASSGRATPANLAAYESMDEGSVAGSVATVAGRGVEARGDVVVLLGEGGSGDESKKRKRGDEGGGEVIVLD